MASQWQCQLRSVCLYVCQPVPMTILSFLCFLLFFSYYPSSVFIPFLSPLLSRLALSFFLFLSLLHSFSLYSFFLLLLSFFLLPYFYHFTHTFIALFFSCSYSYLSFPFSCTVHTSHSFLFFILLSFFLGFYDERPWGKNQVPRFEIHALQHLLCILFCFILPIDLY